MEPFEFYTAQLEASATLGSRIGSHVGSHTETPVIGQYFDQDLIGTTGEMLGGFYASGQLWAMLIGIVLGYGLKSFSSYG